MINYAEYMAEMLRCGWSLNVYGPAAFLRIVGVLSINTIKRTKQGCHFITITTFWKEWHMNYVHNAYLKI